MFIRLSFGQGSTATPTPNIKMAPIPMLTPVTIIGGIRFSRFTLRPINDPTALATTLIPASR